MKFAGRHVLGEMHGCPDLSERRLDEALRLAIEAGGGTLLRVLHHHFEPQGLTTLAVLAESHASIHTFPEANALFFDIFTCGTADPERMAEVLVQELRPVRQSWSTVLRGEQ